MKIAFHHFDFSSTQVDQYAEWLAQSAHQYGYRIEQVTYTLYSQEQMLALNQRYLQHETDTDIITFDYTEGKAISAEVYISAYMLPINAQKFAQSVDSERIRLFSHGLLHCMGFTDKDKQAQQQMRQEEEKCMALFHVKHADHV